MIPALIVIGALLILYPLLFLDGRRFIITKAKISHAKVKTQFTVVQVSDLHDRAFGTKQEKLLGAIREANPDLIVITGDLFNRHKKEACENAFAFVQGVTSVAPVYFAEGNHEISLRETGERYIERIREMGVRVLRNEYADLDRCRLIGLTQYAAPDTLSSMLDSDRLNLVLAHRPELFPMYAGTGADVVLSGHAHGGQFRFFGQGIYAPGQGFFPRYTAGLYRWQKATLYVSRGLGNTIPFPRIFNTPELNVLQFVPIEQGGE